MAELIDGHSLETDGTRRAPTRATRREWLGLAVLALPCLLYSMDLTVLNLALPSLAAALRPSGVELLWIVDIYGFFVAASLVTLGAMGDRFGRRRVLLAGASVFGLTSVLAAFAPSARALIAARALMGVAGASLAPSTLSLIRTLFRDPSERTTAVGVWIASYSLGSAIGPLVGGAILNCCAWGSVFLLAVPVMLLLLVLGPRLLPEERAPSSAPLDVRSAALSLAAVLATTHGIKGLAADGPSLSSLAGFVAGFCLGFVFVRRQRSLVTPLVDFSLFRQPDLRAAFAAYGLACFVTFGVFVFVTQYLQLVLGCAPLAAGFLTVPFALAMTTGSLTTPLLARRVPRRTLMVAGLLVASAGALLLTRLDVTSSRTTLLAGFVVFALGLAPVCVIAPEIIVTSAPAARAGAAAALSETGAELGGAFGIAVLGSLGSAAYRGGLGARAPAGLGALALEEARESLASATTVASSLSAPLAESLRGAARAAFVVAFHGVAGAACALIVASALILHLALRRTP